MRERRGERVGAKELDFINKFKKTRVVPISLPLPLYVEKIMTSTVVLTRDNVESSSK